MTDNTRPSDAILSAAAKTNHDRLFGDRTSTLAQTDPELITVFDNWAFDEVLADAADLDDTLDLPTRLLAQLAAIAAAGGLAEFRVVAAAALARGRVEPGALRELVYQAVPYLGMARAFDYLHAVNDVLTAAGIELPLPGQSASTPDSRHTIGTQVQGRIVGANRVDQMHADASGDTGHFQRYLTGNCFGDVVARHGVDLATRELLTFSMLAGLGGADAQLRGHVAGNLNVGNTRARLLAVLTVIAPFIGYPRTLNALSGINDIAA